MGTLLIPSGKLVWVYPLLLLQLVLKGNDDAGVRTTNTLSKNNYQTHYFWCLVGVSPSFRLLFAELTVKSIPMVSYWRWILSARSSKSRTTEDFSRDIEGLIPERTMAGHVRAIQSQYCRLARQIPEWFPNRQYRAPWRRVKKTDKIWSCSIFQSGHMSEWSIGR